MSGQPFANLPRWLLPLIAAAVIGGAVIGVSAMESWVLGVVVLGGIAAAALLLLALNLFYSSITNRRAAGFNRDLLRDIGKKFDTGLDTFKANDKGIYTLPWYVMVGEPGAGKTEAIRHSSIGFPNGLNKPAQGRGGTVNMDWWFTRKAILLDTAGRLMFEATDEWRSFLKLLRRHRPQTPINGMILAIPTPSLLTDTAEEIAEKAGQIAQQLDVVQRELGVRFPVYVLITKADMIAGFREYFFNLQDPHSQNQMLGWSNPAELDEPFQPRLVDEHLQSVRQCLQRRKLSIMLDPQPLEEGSNRRLDQLDALYAFPSELMRISSRLRMYLEAIFMPNDWSNNPLFLRGIYFTSAMSEGAALDMELAEAFGIDPLELPAELRIFGKEKTYFLRDFFLEKCFPEGGLVTRAKNVAREISTRRLTVITAAVAAACALIAATLYGQMALQKSISKPAAFWTAMADRQQKDPGPWFAMVDPHTGEYLGDRPLPPVLGGSVAGLFHEAQDQDKIRVPLIFKPWERAGHGLDALRRQAEQNLFDQGVMQPFISAYQASLTSGGIDPRSIAAAGGLAKANSGQFDIDPLLKLLYPEKVPSTLSSPAPDTPAGPTVNLPATNPDMTRDTVQKLQKSAQDVMREAELLGRAVTWLRTAKSNEWDLLSLPWPDGLDESATWERAESKLRDTKMPLDKVLAAAGLSNTSLVARFAKLSSDVQSVNEGFARLPPQLNIQNPLADEDQAGAGLSRFSRLVGTSVDDRSELELLDRSYIIDGDFDNRLHAYAIASIRLKRAVGGEDLDWQTFGDGKPIQDVAMPAVNGSSPMDVKANEAFGQMTRYATRYQHEAMHREFLKSIPKNPQDWASAVADRSLKEKISQQIAPLPMMTQQHVLIDPRFVPKAAADALGRWTKFLAVWKRETSADAGEQQAVADAIKALPDYAQNFCAYWTNLQDNPTIVVGDWTAAGKEILADDFYANVDEALTTLAQNKSQAFDTLAEACAFDPALKQQVDAAHPSPPSAEFARYVAASWKTIAAGATTSDQARALLALDPARLFPPDQPTDDLQSRYWKRASIAFLQAIESPATAASTGTFDRVKKQLDCFPVSYPGNGTPLTVADVKQLQQDISGMVAAQGQAAPAMVSVDKQAADILRRIQLGGHGDFAAALQSKAAALDVLTRGCSASLSILPDKQQADLNGGAGLKFTHATFTGKIADNNVTDPQTADWPIDLPTDVGHCDFPVDQLSATISFTATTPVSYDFPGGPWWPLVALHTCTVRPTGEKNHWYIRLPVTTSTGQKIGVWIEMEIHPPHSGDAVNSPWPEPKP